ncbi:hypothetical protein G4B88_020593 [Cannabis sativa]|uniref:Uncharacterized protein n=1 Tax=Cannabis sativa TaxID=3483 RepID=A0A7J6E0L8_CANSA|nr:hypothetical protein G4B88_020593 [Cannabis sativa]
MIATLSTFEWVHRRTKEISKPQSPKIPTPLFSLLSPMQICSVGQRKIIQGHGLGSSQPFKGAEVSWCSCNIFSIENTIAPAIAHVFTNGLGYGFDIYSLRLTNRESELPGVRVGIKVEQDGSNVPQGSANDRSFWLDLLVDNNAKEKVKKGDLSSANLG